MDPGADKDPDVVQLVTSSSLSPLFFGCLINYPAQHRILR